MKRVLLAVAIFGASAVGVETARAEVLHRIAPKELAPGESGRVFRGIIYTRKNHRTGHVTTMKRIVEYKAKNEGKKTVLGDKIETVSKSESWRGPSDVTYVLNTKNDLGHTTRFVSLEHMNADGSKTVDQTAKWVYGDTQIVTSKITAKVADGKASNVQGTHHTQWIYPVADGRGYSTPPTDSHVAPQFKPLLKPGLSAEEQTWKGW